MAPVIVSTTADSESILNEIATALLESRLAACCQISGPVASIYRWKGQIESAQEYTCTIKTLSIRVANVVAVINSMHPYDEPELVVTPIVDGSSSYLNWIAESVS